MSSKITLRKKDARKTGLEEPGQCLHIAEQPLKGKFQTKLSCFGTKKAVLINWHYK